jgi:hypothetical protein
MMMLQDIEERKEQLKKEEVKVKDTTYNLEMQNKVFSGMRNKVQ